MLVGGHYEVGHGPDPRVDEYAMTVREPDLSVKEAKGFLDLDPGGAENGPAPAPVGAVGVPRHRVAERDHPAGPVAGQVAEIADLHPGCGHPSGLAHCERLLERLTDSRRAGFDRAVHLEPSGGLTGPEPGQEPDQSEAVEEDESGVDRGQVREDEKQAEARGEKEPTHHQSAAGPARLHAAGRGSWGAS